MKTSTPFLISLLTLITLAQMWREVDLRARLQKIESAQPDIHSSLQNLFKWQDSLDRKEFYRTHDSNGVHSINIGTINMKKIGDSTPSILSLQTRTGKVVPSGQPGNIREGKIEDQHLDYWNDSTKREPHSPRH